MLLKTSSRSIPTRRFSARDIVDAWNGALSSQADLQTTLTAGASDSARR